METCHLIAAVIGYVVAGLVVAYLALNVWAALWWPFAEMVAAIRFHFADPDSGGWKNFKWWALPRIYCDLLMAYPSNIFTYGEGTTTRYGVGVWHHPTHPLSLGRIEWFTP